MTGILGLLAVGAVAALANLAGGLLVASSGVYRPGAKLLKYLVALGAGFMLAAIFIEILPETFALWADGSGSNSAEGIVGATTLLLGGYLLIQFFEHTVAPHFHFGAETHPEHLMKPSAAYAAIGGLTIHTFFDGVSIASAFLVNFRVGLLVFIAIMLHKLPEGFTVASIMLASGRSPKESRGRSFGNRRGDVRRRGRRSVVERAHRRRGGLRASLLCRCDFVRCGE